MNTLKKALLWLWLLTKRLYKKPAFLLILVLIPLLTFGYRAATAEDSGIITVALAQEGEDTLAEKLMDSIDTSQLIRHIICKSPEEAKKLVTYGKADAAWIFPEDIPNRMGEFLTDPTVENAIVTVYQREETATLRMAREQLAGALYGQLAESYYLHYIRETFPQLDLSDEALMEYYKNTSLTDELFQFETTGTAKETADHYLLTPVRGLLAVVMVLCGLSTAMFYIKDVSFGTFSHISRKKRLLPELASQTVSVVNVGVVVLLTLTLSKLGGDLGKEILVLLFYCGCVVSFCMLLRRLLGSLRLLAGVTPLLVVAMLVLCPVFLDLGSLRTVQYLLPPTYYINAMYATHWLLAMPVYTLCCSALYALLGALGKE